MRTSRLISSITYNTPAFLKSVSLDLVQRGLITHAEWVYHSPDPECKKTHAHWLAEPNGIVNTDIIQKAFREFDPSHPDKPLGMISIRTTAHFGDWYYYGLHDDYYCQMKGYLPRATHYQKSDFDYTDEDLFEADVACRDVGLNFIRDKRLMEAIDQNLRDDEIIRRGIISPAQYNVMKRAMDILRYDNYETFIQLRNQEVAQRLREMLDDCPDDDEHPFSP